MILNIKKIVAGVIQVIQPAEFRRCDRSTLKPGSTASESSDTNRGYGPAKLRSGVRGCPKMKKGDRASP